MLSSSNSIVINSFTGYSRIYVRFEDVYSCYHLSRSIEEMFTKFVGKKHIPSNTENIGFLIALV